MTDLIAAMRGGITQVTVSQISYRSETMPVDGVGTPSSGLLGVVPNLTEVVPPALEIGDDFRVDGADLVEFSPMGMDSSPPDLPLSLYRRIGRRCFHWIRPLALPFLTRLQGRVSLGVDVSISAQILREVLAGQRSIEARLAMMEDALRTLKQVPSEALGPVLSEQHSINARLAVMEDALRTLKQVPSEALGPVLSEQHSINARLAVMEDALRTLKQVPSEALGPVLSGQHSINARLAVMDDALQVLKQIPAEVLGPMLFEQHAINKRLVMMADPLKMLKRTGEETGEHLKSLVQAIDKSRELTALSVEYSSKLLQSRAVALGEDVLVRSSLGWLLVPSEDLRLVTTMLETGGSLEPGTLAVLQAVLEPNDFAVDIGANVGSLTIPMAHSVAPHGRVLAIEPTPRTAKLLQRTCVLAGLEQIIQVEECAIGAMEGVANLIIGVTSGHNSLVPLDEATGSVEVRVRSLDALLPAGSHPALVKIDVEGFELEVWHGMQRLVREAPHLAVIVEFGPSHLLRSGVTIGAWFDALTAPGFTPWEIDEGSGTIRPLRSSGLEDVFSMNLLLLRDSPSRWPRLRVGG